MPGYTRYTQAASFNISLIFPTFPTEFTSEFCDSQPSNDTSFALSRDFQNYEIWSKALSWNKLLWWSLESALLFKNAIWVRVALKNFQRYI